MICKYCKQAGALTVGVEDLKSPSLRGVRLTAILDLHASCPNHKTPGTCDCQHRGIDAAGV